MSSPRTRPLRRSGHGRDVPRPNRRAADQSDLVDGSSVCTIPQCLWTPYGVGPGVLGWLRPPGRPTVAACRDLLADRVTELRALEEALAGQPGTSSSGARTSWRTSPPGWPSSTASIRLRLPTPTRPPPAWQNSWPALSSRRRSRPSRRSATASGRSVSPTGCARGWSRPGFRQVATPPAPRPPHHEPIVVIRAPGTSGATPTGPARG